jgi:hypothetical protein
MRGGSNSFYLCRKWVARIARPWAAKHPRSIAVPSGGCMRAQGRRCTRTKVTRRSHEGDSVQARGSSRAGTKGSWPKRAIWGTDNVAMSRSAKLAGVPVTAGSSKTFYVNLVPCALLRRPKRFESAILIACRSPQTERDNNRIALSGNITGRSRRIASRAESIDCVRKRVHPGASIQHWDVQYVRSAKLLRSG